MFDHERFARFRAAWDAVQIARDVEHGLFTFGESTLPYYLVSETDRPKTPVVINQGEVRITRPRLYTADNAPPELHNFFEDHGDEFAISHLLARTANFRHLKFDNQATSREFTSDSVEEVVERINRKLDDEDEDRVAILVAPSSLAGMALVRYATHRIIESTPGNIQELRERGFLP
jgi:hypothetical protein